MWKVRLWQLRVVCVAVVGGEDVAAVDGETMELKVVCVVLVGGGDVTAVDGETVAA